MKRLTQVFFGIVCCLCLASSAFADTLAKGEIVYTRSTLKADGNTIYWHNMTLDKVIIPIGTEVKIDKCVGNRMVFVTTDTNKTFRVVAMSKYWDKFFVKSKKDLGLDTLSADKKALIDKGEVTIGMTKNEVYMSRGCPAYIKWGVKSEKYPFSDVMLSDKWYYMRSTAGHEKMIAFKDGVVVTIGGYEQ